MYRRQELADLGERIAADGPHRHERELEELALAVRTRSPGAAAVLSDRSAPSVLRERAFGVLADVVLRTPQWPEEPEPVELEQVGEELQRMIGDGEGQLVGWGA